MATTPVSLFFKNNRVYGIDTIAFDLVLSETHNYTSTVTTHAVEDGSTIADHIHNELENGTLNGLISNYSLSIAGGPLTNRAQIVFDALVDIWKRKQLVTITTVMKVYTDVAITSMPFMRDSSQGESLPISVSFEQVNVVRLQQVQLEVSVAVADLETPTNRQVATETNIGETTGEEKTIVGDNSALELALRTFTR